MTIFFQVPPWLFNFELQNNIGRCALRNVFTKPNVSRIQVYTGICLKRNSKWFSLRLIPIVSLNYSWIHLFYFIILQFYIYMVYIAKYYSNIDKILYKHLSPPNYYISCPIYYILNCLDMLKFNTYCEDI